MKPLDLSEDFGIFNIISGLCSSLFDDFDSFSFDTDMKFDQIQQKWTSNCSSVESCQFGVNNNTDYDDLCPSCFVTEGEKCGKWIGECGEGLACQYDVTTSGNRQGVCVTQSVMTSRQLGDTCGKDIGDCDDDFRCMHEADPMSSYISVSGVCVTPEVFGSRMEGQTCGDLVGECNGGDDITCAENFRFGQKFCHRKGADMQGGGVEFVIEIDGNGFGDLGKSDAAVGGIDFLNPFVSTLPLFDDWKDEDEKEEETDNDDQDDKDEITTIAADFNDQDSFAEGLKMAIKNSANKISFDKNIDEIVESVIGDKTSKINEDFPDVIGDL